MNRISPNQLYTEIFSGAAEVTDRTQKMLHLYLLPCVMSLSVSYSWYLSRGFQFSFDEGHQQQGIRSNVRTKHIVSEYMWDIYNSGLNSSEFDVVKGIYPKTSVFFFNSLQHRNHRRQQLEFFIPQPEQEEPLAKVEMRIYANGTKCLETSFQVYLKTDKWVFLGEKKISNVDTAYISFHVTPVTRIAPGVATFLLLSLCRKPDSQRDRDHFHPVLLLFYLPSPNRTFSAVSRTKRSLQPEGYEEETNRIWEEEFLPQGTSVVPKRVRNACRRKSLYIKFSEIDFDSWVVAPSGYEAFQCVGKCTFPLGEHLSPTKHAILQTLVHNMHPWKAPKACCVPTRLDPISMLYVDDSGVLTYRFRYHDMVVAECGCR